MGGLYTLYNNHTWIFYIFFIMVLIIALASGISLTGDTDTKSYSSSQRAIMGILFYIVFLNASILSNVVASNIITSSKNATKSAKVACSPNDPTCKNEE